MASRGICLNTQVADSNKPAAQATERRHRSRNYFFFLSSPLARRRPREMPKPAGPHSLRLDRASVRPERASARNNGCPTSHLARTLGTALLVPCMPHPRRTARAPHDPCPQSWRGPGSPLVSPGLRELVGDAPRPLTCGELAVGRPQKRPRGEEQERHKSRQRRRRRIHAEFGRSFKQLCKELPGGSPRNPRRRRGPGLAG